MSNCSIHVSGARGGHGASTVAAVLALTAARRQPTQLVAHDLADMAAMLGLMFVGHQPSVTVSDTLTVARHPTSGVPVVIHDDGQKRTAENGSQLVVLRGPCYLGLRELLAAPQRPDGLVLVSEPGRSLTTQDVSDVLGVPVVATVPFSAGVARTIDAGILPLRFERIREFASLRRYLASILPNPPDAALRPIGAPIADLTPPDRVKSPLRGPNFFRHRLVGSA